MDKTRELRYLTPPMFFLGMLLLGAWLGGADSIQWYVWKFRHVDEVMVAALSAALVASLFPLGFAIQSVSINLQRFVVWCVWMDWGAGFLPEKRQHYFAYFSDDTWTRIANAMQIDVTTLRKYPAPSSIWQFEKWDKRVSEAVVRLWTAFNVALGSIVAIVAAFFIGHFALHIPVTWSWVGWSCFLTSLFATSAWTTWKEHMKAYEFQAIHLDRSGDMAEI